ncbi:hypothetical protein J5N97_018267 [Dioscorea zingiberensis]|uniref:Phospholipase n=1 Tax=Dioscorea zingiberensis TaxID=325984 RepID=A0A9D5CPW4_9LILI|nr:hypothetical protein J5N97_018267 [Dioscorea zingiberensis]
MPSERAVSGSGSFRLTEAARIFDELPEANIVSISEPDASDITPLLLTYTIEFQYKQFKWRLMKKASQVLYLHFALKKRAFIDEIHQNREQVKEWLQSIGLGEHTAVGQEDDEVYTHPSQHEENFSARNRNIPSRAALLIMRPALGRQQSISDRAKVAMQGYLNHFLGNLDIVNSREVCEFLEVSKLSFSSEYGPKLKEGYVTAQHLRKSQKDDAGRCCPCHLFWCCNGKWRKVWAVLKPGFLALLEDPFDSKLLDIVIFDKLPSSVGNGLDSSLIAKENKEHNPLRGGFVVSCGNRTIKLKTTSNAKEWVSAINSSAQCPREGWCHPHRFGSFAPSRGLIEDGSLVQWFIDGEAAFDAIASSIEEAKSEIFITDWWLCPELYLRRPFLDHESSRLDLLLEAKAKQGVQVYILLYKEIALALKINSTYSQRRLLNLHENVKVLRYPDHFSAGVYLWSHHEKIVIVDHRICYIGGLDLCFGRYDTPRHKLGDFPSLLWPGKDYYNPRESEPNSWEDIMKDELDRRKYPRMPWHDVQCAIWGPSCHDVARHFVQRWNYAKRNKAPNEQSIPLLMPQQHMVIPHYMGKDRQRNGENKHINHTLKRHDSFSSPSIQDIPLLLPRDPDAQQIVNGDHKCTDKEWWETQEQGNQVASIDEIRQVGPRLPCRCQIIRSVGQWSAGTGQTEASIHDAYISLIEKAEHFIYIENQFFISGLSGDDVIQNRLLEAMYKRILRAEQEKKCFRVIIVIPLLPGFQGGLDDSGAASVRALVHWQYRTISRGPNSILQRLCDVMGPRAHDYISFYGLRTYGKLSDGGPVVTNQVYVHSKLMIVDDRIVLLGSANINDRSLLGSRDSEIGIVIEDKVFVASYMNGTPWKAGGFALSLRLSLWSEHLGLRAGETSRIYDPVVDASYKDIWMGTAEKNTRIYQEVFACIPNDHIHSRAAIRQNTTYWKEKLGHTTIDLGVAPEKLEPLQNGDNEANKDTDPLERLKAVKGHLVLFPLKFMCQQEDLRPFFNEGEFYASAQVFH